MQFLKFHLSYEISTYKLSKNVFYSFGLSGMIGCHQCSAMTNFFLCVRRTSRFLSVFYIINHIHFVKAIQMLAINTIKPHPFDRYWVIWSIQLNWILFSESLDLLNKRTPAIVKKQSFLFVMQRIQFCASLTRRKSNFNHFDSNTIQSSYE